jgi:hypothetical protein
MGHEFPRHDFHLRPSGTIDVGGTAEENQCFEWENSTRRFGNRRVLTARTAPRYKKAGRTDDAPRCQTKYFGVASESEDPGQLTGCPLKPDDTSRR